MFLYILQSEKNYELSSDDRKFVTISRNEAHEFLTLRSKRVKRDRNLEDECCYTTWCDLEEMEERHENNGFSKPIPYIVNWLR